MQASSWIHGRRDVIIIPAYSPPVIKHVKSPVNPGEKVGNAVATAEPGLTRFWIDWPRWMNGRGQEPSSRLPPG
ncbi:hypothetical protein NUW54_g7398 [Trametes sanguinea]|uniref:Uncharacterized protein n=1 Tax=Trametes sanguinea TaxID=158606 RepID=A0ACC1PP71_9APHY|nr:hypothetical protein NUW54_g7398 [Trametes sanguinea]